MHTFIFSEPTVSWVVVLMHFVIVLALFLNCYSYVHSLTVCCIFYAKQKHLGCKKGEANQKQQLSDYRCIRT